MPFVLAGIASMLFGVGDFVGGYASRRAPVVSIVLTSQFVGGSGILIAAWVVFDGTLTATGLAWGAAAGLAGGAGLVALYHALATTRMGVAAPVTAVFGTVSPVLFGIAIGERPSWIAWGGIVLGVCAVVLIARTPDVVGSQPSSSARAVALGAAAGLGFGLFGILISRTGADAGLWPLVGARLSSIVLLLGMARVLRHPVVAPEGRSLAAVAGVLDMAANALYLVAVRRELLSLITVIMAMYPVGTVGLARVVLRERLHPLQVLGFLLGAAAIVMIVV